MSTNTPNMNLTKPTEGVTPGPDWATQINSSLDKVDAHDHSSGKGSKITPAGMNINADLSFSSKAITNSGGVGFAMRSVAPTGDNYVFMNTSGTLQWKTVSGTYDLITSSGIISGGFTGDYTSSTGEANYSDTLKLFTFLQNTGITAGIQSGPISIYENVVSSNSVTLDTVSSLASSYTITLPSALPGSTLPLLVDASGDMAYGDQSLNTTDNVTFNDLIVDGDLTVNGTTTTINTTNLDVEDSNITINNGGNDASSEGAGLTVERTGTNGSFVYEDALASKFKLGALGSEVEVADVSSTQTLTNKTVNTVTPTEFTQLANIDATTISTTQWGYLGAMDQNVRTTDDVNFGAITGTGLLAAGSSASGTHVIQSTSNEVLRVDCGGSSIAKIILRNSSDVDAEIYNNTGRLYYDTAASQFHRWLIGGTQYMNLSTSGGLALSTKITVANGSAAAPSYSFGNDVDTGFFYSSSGVTAYASNGSDRLRFGNSYLLPTTNNFYSLGGTSNRWANVYSVAGNFSGALSKGSGSFKIDHPKDPTNKWLYHSFVESDEVLNIYRGNVIMDANGEATVALPEWFNEVNENFSYQLTCIGGFANVYISEELDSVGDPDQFSIAGGTEGLKVSWIVTGVRKDPFIKQNPINVEVDKTGEDLGLIQHEEAYEAEGLLPEGYVKRADRNMENNS